MLHCSWGATDEQQAKDINISQKFYRHWHRLPREATVAPSCKARLDVALNNLEQWKMSLPMAGGLEQDDI